MSINDDRDGGRRRITAGGVGVGERERLLSTSGPNRRVQRVYDTTGVTSGPALYDSVGNAVYRTIGGRSRTGSVWSTATRPRLDSNYVALVTDKGPDLSLGVHQMPWPDVAKLLNVAPLDPHNLRSARGLSSSDAAVRLVEQGPNVITPPKKTPEWLKYLRCYANMFMLLLAVAGVLCFAIYELDRSQKINLWLGVILFIVVILTSTMEYFQARAASKVMAQIAGLVGSSIVVVRDGVDRAIPPAELVLGDIVRVKSGDRVPADLRLLACNDLKVDNASLTGEAEPQLRAVESTSSEMLESANMAFSGTLVTDGEGVGIVVATADACMVGQISSMAAAEKGTLTPLEIEIKRFVRIIGCISAMLAVTFMILGVFVGKSTFAYAAYNAMGLLVANVPQGLPATVAITLFIAAKRMRASNVVVKTLQQVETLGSVSMICSDKTGTLTQNRMTASNCWTPAALASGDAILPVRDTSSASVPRAAVSAFVDVPAGRALLAAVTLCSRARFAAAPDGSLNPELRRQAAAAIESTDVLGDATESGFLRFAAKVSDYEALRQATEKVFEVPFNSVNKFQLSIHDRMAPHRPDRVDRVLFFKGAPEIVLGKCSFYYQAGADGAAPTRLPIDDAFRARFETQYRTLGSMGERVLGFAELPLDEATGLHSLPPGEFDFESGNVPTDNLVFLGLLSLIDPPKASVPPAVEMCRTAGIQIIMMTGDHPLTAEAIARQVGIIRGRTAEEVASVAGIPVHAVDERDVDAVVVHGTRIASLTEADWDSILSKREIVFARMSPMHKVNIVENCQRRGAIVAVTGDGVNDSPSLKKANVGIAMGIAGSEVAKDAADIILLDDDFASIVLGVRVGRVIFDNLAKAIVYILVHLTTEMWPVLINILFGIPLALQAAQMLLIDLGTEIVPGVALGFETAEKDVMSRPPRNPVTQHLISFKALAWAYVQGGSFQSLGCLFAFFMVMHFHGIAPHELWRGSSDTAKFTPSILRDGQTAYFIGIVMSQCFTIIALRTRSTTLFKHPPFSNKVIFWGWLYSLGLAAFVVYTPVLNHAIYFNAVPFYYWFLAMPGGFLIITWAELVKWARRVSCIPLRSLQF